MTSRRLTTYTLDVNCFTAQQVAVYEPCTIVYEFSSVQFLDQLGHQGYMRDNSAETLFHSFLQEALVSSSGMGRDIHSLMLSIQHFLYQPQRHPPSKVS